MITVAKPKPRLRAGARMSLDEFLALGETDERLELIDGALYIMSTPTKDHQFLLARLIVYFELYLDAFTPAPCGSVPGYNHHSVARIATGGRA